MPINDNRDYTITITVINLIISILLCFHNPLNAQDKLTHPIEGETLLDTTSISIRFETRKQNYDKNDTLTRDKNILSPKSISIHPEGKKYYVNALEGARTIVYDFDSGRRLKTIHHRFDSTKLHLWAPDSNLFVFKHSYDDTMRFYGKPVEAAFSHGGMYLWIPYYRRSFDLNAQEPSAMAVIDTRVDKIIRVFETGPLPKMVVSSPDSRKIAVAHWGDNTIGVIDIESLDPTEWHYEQLYIVDKKLELDYSLTDTINRDVGSGYCLRGSVFTPDSRHLLVACMGGAGGIAVVDIEQQQYLGRLTGVRSNARHIIIKDDHLYASINKSGYVQKIALDSIYHAIDKLKSSKIKHARAKGWSECKIPKGARTIVASPDGRYIFAACNTESKLAVVDTESMNLIGTIDVDSYPVGLDISADGQYIFTTSQGRNNKGGNAVDIFKIEYK